MKKDLFIKNKIKNLGDNIDGLYLFSRLRVLKEV